MDTLLGWCSHRRSAGLLPCQVLKELVSGKGLEGGCYETVGEGALATASATAPLHHFTPTIGPWSDRSL